MVALRHRPTLTRPSMYINIRFRAKESQVLLPHRPSLLLLWPAKSSTSDSGVGILLPLALFMDSLPFVSRGSGTLAEESPLPAACCVFCPRRRSCFCTLPHKYAMLRAPGVIVHLLLPPSSKSWCLVLRPNVSETIYEMIPSTSRLGYPLAGPMMCA
jgi:hypothetical protein